MCTLTYIPKENGYLLGNSRDVGLDRANAIFPSFANSKTDERLVFAKDYISQGSWLVINSNFFSSVCLLNGGYQNHIQKEKYRQSRGLIPLHFFDYKTAEEFIRHYDFADLEPFTLIAFEGRNRKLPLITELIWTGEHLIASELPNTQALIWSSSTLYNQEAKETRSQWFEQYLLLHQEDLNIDSLAEFHHLGGIDCPLGEVRIKSYHPNGVQTVSISILDIDLAHQEGVFKYHDLVANQISLFQL